MSFAVGGSAIRVDVGGGTTTAGGAGAGAGSGAGAKHARNGCGSVDISGNRQDEQFLTQRL